MDAMAAHHLGGECVIGWYASRKLNGWHVIWDCQNLWTLGRYSGKKRICAPHDWTDKLPDFECEGELWHRSDNEGVIKSIAGQGPEKCMRDFRWKNLRFMAFDTREIGKTWLARQAKLATKPDNEVYQKIHWEKVSDPHIFLNSLGPQVEGIMLANPQGYYEFKRSRNLLKLKHCYETEATIFNSEAGKHTGRMGALNCALKWDEKVTSVRGGATDMIGREVIFNVGGGFADTQRDWDYVKTKFKPGTVIRFSYLGVTEYGVPISPNFLEIL